MSIEKRDFTINDTRRKALDIQPDYWLVNSEDIELSVIFEQMDRTFLVFAKEKYPDGMKKELGGGLGVSYEEAVKALFSNRYLPFYSLQIPLDAVK